MDTVSKAKRSEIMRSIKSKDTKPELLMAQALRGIGRRVERPKRNCKTLRGSPDFVYWKARVAVFVHGCFWHRHSCMPDKLPKTNTEFWRRKFERNVKRDRTAAAHLRKAGWSVLTVWECNIKDAAGACEQAVKIVNKVWQRANQ